MSKNKKEEIKELKVACPPDPRYQNSNISEWCFNLFVDYHKCTRLLGKKHEPCQYFYKCFHSICPNAWIAKFEDQMKEGSFPHEFPEPKD